MNSVSCSTSSIEISTESEVINDDESHSSTTLLSSFSRELDSSPSCYEDIQSYKDEDSLHAEDFSTKFENESQRTEWEIVQQEKAIQIKGSVVIVPPSIEHDLLQKEQSEDVNTSAKDKPRIVSSEQDSDSIARPRENNMSSIIEKLARNGVTITCNKFHQKSSFYNSMPKMRNISTCSNRYNPLLPCQSSYPNITICRNHHRNQTANKNNRLLEKNEVQIQTRKLFSDCSRTYKQFVCNFCDRLFKSLECLKTHLQIHCISYWRTPFSWMEETISQNANNDRDSEEIDLFRALENQNGTYEEGFTCQVCDMIFATVEGLSKHMHIHRTSHTKVRIEDSKESISEEGYATIDLTD